MWVQMLPLAKQAFEAGPWSQESVCAEVTGVLSGLMRQASRAGCGVALGVWRWAELQALAKQTSTTRATGSCTPQQCMRVKHLSSSNVTHVIALVAACQGARLSTEVNFSHHLANILKCEHAVHMQYPKATCTQPSIQNLCIVPRKALIRTCCDINSPAYPHMLLELPAQVSIRRRLSIMQSLSHVMDLQDLTAKCFACPLPHPVSDSGSLTCGHRMKSSDSQSL